VNRIRIGITGESGFLGSFVRIAVMQKTDAMTLVPFLDEYFGDPGKLDDFVGACDVIVHLAAMNRTPGDPGEIYDTNMRLVHLLCDGLRRRPGVGHVIFASSTQEVRDTPYGRSKRDGREVLRTWADEVGATCTSMSIPNVFGPFCRPYYNSVIATFCQKVTHGETPEIDVDAEIPYVFVWDVANAIIHAAGTGHWDGDAMPFPITTVSVSSLRDRLLGCAACYGEEGRVPQLETRFDTDLFNTFRSYYPAGTFPFLPAKRTDHRGYLVEVLKTGTGGQVFFSHTEPGITRGNHYHTRKIERFSVLEGEGLIRIRRVGGTDIQEYRLTGEQPAAMDMPVFCTHSISNVGDGPLLTLFWSNEIFDPLDPDTFYDPVMRESE